MLYLVLLKELELRFVKIMAWSKITNNKPKPIGWWYHKIMAELTWWLAKKDMIDFDAYYIHVRSMVNKYKLNLYGEKI